MGQMHAREFMVGAAVGSVLGGVAALLVAPKAGRKLREDIYDTYCNLSDKTEALAKKGKSLTRGVSCKSSDWTDTARSFLGGTIKNVKGLIADEEEEYTTRDLLIGGLIGGVLGAAVGLLIAPKSGDELRNDLVETYEDISEKAQDFTDNVSKKGKSFVKQANSKANKWLDFAKDIVDNLAEEVEDKGEDLLGQVRGLFNNNKVNDVLDWAQVGYRAWQGIQSKRRR